MADKVNIAVLAKPNAAEGVSRSALQKDIRLLSGALTKVNLSIHTLAIRCMEHAFTYGDVMNTAAALVDAIPTSMRRSLVIDWFGHFSPITLGKDAKTGKMRGHLKGVQAERVWNIEAAKATPFYAMVGSPEEPNVPTYESIHDNIIAFVKRMVTAVEKIPNEGDKAKALLEVTKLKNALAA